jgi:hypothetical protein
MRTFPLPRVVFSVCRVLVRLVALTLPWLQRHTQRPAELPILPYPCLRLAFKSFRKETHALERLRPLSLAVDV